MQSDLLPQLLTGDDEASTAARALLGKEASYTDMGLVASTESLARTYGRRLRLTQRQRTKTLGLERAVHLLAAHTRPVRLGQLKAADGSWVFMLFLDSDGQSLLACTGMSLTEEHPL